MHPFLVYGKSTALADMEERQLPLQILSVDDDPVNRRVLQRHLEELGHQVDSAVQIDL